MAVRDYSMLQDDYMRAKGVLCVQWTLNNGDTGAPIAIPDYQDKTVQVSGTFGSGGSVSIEGANDPSSPVYATLVDPQGNNLTFTSAKIEAVLENPYLIRPNCTAGDGTTSLKITLVAVKKRP